MHKVLRASIAVVFLLGWVVAQAQQAKEDYLDVYIVHVKPEKRADFDAIAKKIAVANRGGKGDAWIAIDTVYGPGNRVSFISTRHSYGEIQTAQEAFLAAIQKAYGKGTDKVFQDFSQCVASDRSEIRRRRWDLSSNAPTDPAAYAKLIANSRYLRTAAVQVRPGQAQVFEGILRDLKEAREKASPPLTSLVSQTVAGTEGTVYYITTLQPNMAGFDGIPTAQQLLGDEGYQKFLKASADTVVTAETSINRFNPDLSSVPEEIASLAPNYWTPKTAMPVNAKTSTPKSGLVNAKETKTEPDKN